MKNLMKLKPRFVKRANAYVVTEIIQGEQKGKEKQLQKLHWFQSLDEALTFYK